MSINTKFFLGAVCLIITIAIILGVSFNRTSKIESFNEGFKQSYLQTHKKPYVDTVRL